MRIKILYLTCHPEIGGGETSLLYLLEKIDRKKYDPVVVVTHRGQVSDKLKQIKINYYVVNTLPYLVRLFFMPGFNIKAFLKLYKIVDVEKPKIIHINQPTLVLYAGIIGKIKKIPVIATSHGTWDTIYFFHDLLNQIFINKILPVSPEVNKALQNRGIIKNKTKTVFLGIDTKKFVSIKNKSFAKKLFLIPPENKVVTMACRFDFGKNHITFLKIANKLIKSYDKITFLIVGDYKKNLEKNSKVATNVKKLLDDYLDKNKSLKKKIIFTGFQKNMVPVYQATDILFSTSQSETLPVSFMEAASASLPIIAVKNISTKWIVINNKNGFLINKIDKQKLVNLLLYLLKNSKIRKEYGNNSRSIALKRFDINIYTNKLDKIYSEVLQSYK